MKYAVIVIAVAVILFALLILLSEFKVILVYTRKGEDDSISLKLSAVGGLLALKYDIPMADILKLGIRSIVINKRQKEAEKKFVDLKELYDRYKHIRSAIEKHGYLTGKIKNYLVDNNRIIIEKIKLDIIIGLEDASKTGIVSGVIWALLGNLDSFISNNFKVLDKKFFVKPDYTEEALKINFLCIISTRIVHIIVVGFILAITGIKKEIIDRRWFKWRSIQ